MTKRELIDRLEQDPAEDSSRVLVYDFHINLLRDILYSEDQGEPIVLIPGRIITQ